MPKQKVIKKSALSPTVLIAGGAGFIGSHLAERFLDEGARVVVVDNFRTGKDVYIESLQKNDNFAFFDANINEGIPENIQSVDYIVHLASVESYLYSRDQVNLDSLLTNALGTKNLLDFAQKSQAKFLLVSSIDVYEGLMSPLNLDEYFGHTQEEEKRYSLSEAKRFAEALVWEYYNKHETDVRIVRLPEVYGPRMNLTSSGSLGKFLQEVINHHSLTIRGEGTEKEHYLYITDVISGLVKSLLKKNTKGQIYTLAPKEPQTILETAYLIKGLANSAVDIKFKQNTPDSTYRTPKIPDTSNLHELDWTPKTNLKAGIKKTLSWFGYESNENAFKPNKLAEKKQRQKEIKNGVKVTTLADEQTVAEESSKRESVKKEREAEKTESSIKPSGLNIRWPSLSLPSFSWLSFSWLKNPFADLEFKSMWLAIPIIAVVLIILVPPAHAFTSAVLGMKNLEKSQQAVTNANIQEVTKQTTKAFQNFNRAQKSLKMSKWLFLVTGTEDKYDSLSNLTSSAVYFSKGAYDASKGVEPFLSVWEVLNPNSTSQLDTQAFSTSKTNFNKAQNSFQRASAEFKNVNTETIPFIDQAKLEQYEQGLQTINANVSTAKILAAEIPNLLGAHNQSKTYLILFQNSNELRPTGGFIGSYSVLELNDGKIQNLTIDDIYNPDGQIDVQNIETGEPLKVGELLGEEKQYLRNSNWHPNFKESSQEFVNIYEQVTDTKVDGVFAVDLYFVKSLLKVTGPVYLTAYGEEIDSNNLYERTQYHSGFNYQNGSDQKRAFLTVLGSKLLENVFALENEELPNLISQTISSLEQKHILISLPNSTVGAELNEQNWDGSLVDTEGDYLYVVNANVGGTKSNYYIDNSMDYEVSSKTRDGLLRGKLELTYTHNGESDAWPGGPYTNYVRVLTQNGSKLTGATLNVGGETQDIFEDVVIDNVDQYTSYEQLIEIAPQETGVLTFYYDLPTDLSITEENKNYTLYWQKQPGTQDDNISFNFEQPFGTEASGDVVLETQLNTDKFLEISIE